MSAPNPLHRWDLSPEEAVRVQTELRAQLSLHWDGRPVTTVAGVDMSLAGGQAHAAMVVFRYPDLTPLEAVTADALLVFPYVPGLLAFREGPAILAAWAKLQHLPDVVMFDGQGIAHPRGLGIAAHMGLWLQRPTIGVAKSFLYGRHTDPGPNAGDHTPIYDMQTPEPVIGAMLRTRLRGNPLYISPGHLIDAPTALQFVWACCKGYRLPEPTRWAHKVAAGEVFPVAEQSSL